MTHYAPVGFAGLGIMGGRMAARFLGAGHPLTVWNRTASRAAPLVEKGAQLAPDLAALAAAADTIFLNLADPPAVLGAIEAMRPSLRPGHRVIDFSTISPAAAKAARDALAACGAGYLEAPVTGSKNGAAQGTLLIMTSGDPALFEAARPLLDVVSQKQIYCGDTGSASLVKLLGNNVIAHMLVGIAQGIVTAREGGVDPAKLLEVVQASGFASPYYSFKGGQMLARDFDTHFSLDLLHKDLKLLVDTAAPLKVPLPGASAMLETVQAARARGLGGEDIAAVVKVFEVERKGS